jgi:hypothetical protein
VLLLSSITAAHEDLARNSGPARQYNSFSSTAATRLDDGTTARQYNAATYAARRVELLLQEMAIQMC